MDKAIQRIEALIRNRKSATATEATTYVIEREDSIKAQNMTSLINDRTTLAMRKISENTKKLKSRNGTHIKSTPLSDSNTPSVNAENQDFIIKDQSTHQVQMDNAQNIDHLPYVLPPILLENLSPIPLQLLQYRNSNPRERRDEIHNLKRHCHHARANQLLPPPAPKYSNRTFNLKNHTRGIYTDTDTDMVEEVKGAADEDEEKEGVMDEEEVEVGAKVEEVEEDLTTFGIKNTSIRISNSNKGFESAERRPKQIGNYIKI